jgi:hypothetical protein
MHPPKANTVPAIPNANRFPKSHFFRITPNSGRKGSQSYKFVLGSPALSARCANFIG